MEVSEDKRGIGYAIGLLVKGTEVIRLIDLDDQSEQQVSDMKASGVKVLSRRNLESYLFDNDVLRMLAESVGESGKVEKLLDKKKSILESRPDDRPDDLKPASGQIYVACKQILNIAQPGNDAKTFMARHPSSARKARNRYLPKLKDRHFRDRLVEPIIFSSIPLVAIPALSE